MARRPGRAAGQLDLQVTTSWPASGLQFQVELRLQVATGVCQSKLRRGTGKLELYDHDTRMWRGVSGLARPPPSEAKRGYCITFLRKLPTGIREIRQCVGRPKIVSAHKFRRRRRPLFSLAMARLLLVAVVLSLLLGVEAGKRGGKGKPGKAPVGGTISAEQESGAISPPRAPEVAGEPWAHSESGEPGGKSPQRRRRVSRLKRLDHRHHSAVHRAEERASQARSTASQVSLCTTGPPCTHFLTRAFLCRALPARPWDLPRFRKQLRQHQLSATPPHPGSR